MMWMNGEIRNTTTVAFDVADRGLLLGDGLFETLLVLGKVPFRLDAHLARLEAGATLLRLAVDMATARRAVTELAARLEHPSVIRLTVTRGVGPRGLAIPEVASPLIFATSAPWSAAGAFKPQHLRVSAIRRNDTSPLSGMKALPYLDNVLALDSAVKAGADDALLLSTRGTVACTAVANVFALMGRRLVTPQLRDGVLPGTTRALLLALAPSCGLVAEERSLALDDLRGAEAVLTTNSLRLIGRAISLDGHPLPDRGSAALARMIQGLRAAIMDECGWDLPVPAGLADGEAGGGRHPG